MVSTYVILPISIKSPPVGRRPAAVASEADTTSDETNGDASAAGSQAPLSSAQRLVASTAPTASGGPPVDDPYALDAKYFTEMRVLNREVIEILVKFSS